MIQDTQQHDPVAERLARIADGIPAHYFDCDEVEIPDHGVRKARCDCTATDDMNVLLAFARDVLALAERWESRMHERGEHSGCAVCDVTELHARDIRDAANRHLGGAQHDQ